MRFSARRAVPAVLVAAICAASSGFAEPDLKPTQARLASTNPDERVAGVRELMRLKPSAEVARPILEKLVVDPERDVREDTLWAVHDLLGAKGIDLLEQFYNDSDRTIRDNAIRAACQMWSVSRAKSLCTSALDNSDFAARVEVLSALKEFHPSEADVAPLFRRGLNDPSEMVQRAAVFGTQAARDASAVPDLARLARTSSDTVAVPAVEEALATIGSATAIKELIALLPKPEPGKKTPTDNVRAAAARALARGKDKSAAPALRPLLGDASVIVRIGAMEALMEIGDKGAIPAISNLLADPDDRVRKTALRSLRKMKDPAAAPAVRKTLKEDKDPAVRAMAVSCLADILREGAISDLGALKSDLDVSVRVEAAGALGGLGKPAAKALTSFLADADGGVQALAIEGLGQVGGPEQVPALSALLSDPAAAKNKQLRGAVAQALGGIGHADGIPVLLKLVKDPEPMVRQKVAQSLGKIGGPKVQESLQALAKDEIASVRATAKRALEDAAKGPKSAAPAPPAGGAKPAAKPGAAPARKGL